MGKETSTGAQGGIAKGVPHLSLLAAWAFAFGCAVGSDAFVMPWTDLLPEAGPLGTSLGILAGGLVMAVVAWNYHYLANRFPGPGGAYTYATKAFGNDHGFLCAWFLCLAYVAIVWMDSIALTIVARFLFDDFFDFGFRYHVAGYDISLGNLLLSISAIGCATAICCRRRLSGRVQTTMALVFAAGIVACFTAAAFHHEGGLATMGPAFAANGTRPVVQVLGIVAISPWIFVGFESIIHSSDEFRFPARKTFGVMAAALATAVAGYILLVLLPPLVMRRWATARPSGDLFAFVMAGHAFGRAGAAVVGATLVGAGFPNLVGNTVAASRLLAAMADDGALPPWLGGRNTDGAPRNAVLAIAGVSLLIPALGEGVLGVIVDIALLGAALAYAYTSASAFHIAREEGNRPAVATGVCGLLFSVAVILDFVFRPTHASGVTSMSSETYLLLVVWCIAGILCFLSVFRRDPLQRFGRSPVAWLSLMAAILILSFMWVRQAAYDTTQAAFGEIVRRHGEFLRARRSETPCDVARFSRHWAEGLRGQQAFVNRMIQRNNFVQSGLTVLALAFMVRLFLLQRSRERRLENEKAAAKSYFFSTVSHDIRTPLNAIIGFSEMLKSGFDTEAERERAVDSILVSGKTLLGLINDVLDLSKLESGKMAIVPEPTDVPRLAHDILDAFRAAGAMHRGVELRCRAGAMPRLMLDPQRLRQIAFNLVGNAVKFTDQGHVELRISFERAPDAPSGTFRLEVEDTGCGIAPEDVKRAASAYVQFGSPQSRGKGTGLGLAICRQLAAAMGGELGVTSVPGEGSTFSVTIPGVATAPETPEAAAPRDTPPAAPAPDSAGPVPLPRRILLVDDTKVNLLVLRALLHHIGDFDVAMADDGAEALKILETPSGAGPFDLVLTDLWMPNLDGQGLLLAIRANPALAPLRVAVVTADVEMRDKAAGMGFDGVLLKPITTESLLGLLRKLKV